MTGGKRAMAAKEDNWTEKKPPEGKAEHEKEDKSGFGERAEDEEILRFLDYYPKSVDDIARAMDEKGTVAEIPEIFSKLIGLCIIGRAKQISGNYFVKIDK